MRTIVPPIKSQGIKTKLVPWIKSIVPHDFDGTWIEPFMGTGAVAFNIAPKRALLCDTNPHLINFYASIQSGEITSGIAKEFLCDEGSKLKSKGQEHYYAVRERFNREHAPLDFLFLNRAGFNGMIRFNRAGGFNIPFCRKPNRFAQSYVTKISNQIACISKIIGTKEFVFKCQPFAETVKSAKANDLIYCDPPYIGRHVDYYNGWDEGCERSLFGILDAVPSRFILSTWHHNDFRANEYVASLWGKFNVLTKDHFYHVGGSEANRNPVVEALIANFSPVDLSKTTRAMREQYSFLELV
jgi:DNA adenine methylase